MAADGAERTGKLAVHVDHVAVARGLVQPIDVLCDDQDLGARFGLQSGKRQMRLVGPRLRRLRAARVVEPVHKGGVAGKGLGRGHVLDPVLRPDPARIAERAKPAFGGNARAGENDDLFHRALLPYLCQSGGPMTTRILFVCLGNICRSPAAEGVFRALAPWAVTDSAGTSGWHEGDAPYGPMQDAARARGLDLSDLRARRVRARDFERFDLIIAMDAETQADTEALRPAGNTTPVRLFTDYAPDRGAGHVPDPYYTRDFEGTLDLIEACARGLVADLRR